MVEFERNKNENEPTDSDEDADSFYSSSDDEFEHQKQKLKAKWKRDEKIDNIFLSQEKKLQEKADSFSGPVSGPIKRLPHAAKKVGAEET